MGRCNKSKPGDLPLFLTKIQRPSGKRSVDMRYTILYILLVCSVTFYTSEAQIDSLRLLPEVVLSDIKLRENSQGIHIETLSDSLIKQDVTLLTQVLRDHTAIFFRENGPGGVSSASFRGTNAQQTAVVWNGININSQLTGQTDFNTIAAYNYDAISVRSGGGSILYGSGAVGGSVHLENTMRFGDRFENQVVGGYASFDSRLAQAKSTYATDRFYTDIAGDYIASENDFGYPNSEQFNENGQYENLNLNANIGILLSSDDSETKQVLKLHHNSFLGDRNFAGTLIAASDDAYQDRNTRTLLSWERLSKKYEGRASIAHIFEQFRFFPTASDRSINSLGKANRFVASYDGTYRFDNTKSLKAVLTADQIEGAGSSIADATRQLYAAVVMYNHKVSDRFNYGIQLRQELTDEYDNPFLIGVGGEYAFAKAKINSYKLSFNASRNYRIPTFNDLYWQGAGAVGNPDIIPETSLQAEIGQELILKNFAANARVFFISTDDLILWQPNSQNIWSPQNLNQSIHYGTEIDTSYKYDFEDHSISSEVRYSYTIAENADTGNQLAYVPKQQVAMSLGYQYKYFTTNVQGSYTDRVFVTGDESQQIPGYFVLDARLSTQLLNKKDHKMHLGITLKNALNKEYLTVRSRPNPGRNFLIQTTYIF